MAKVKDTAKRVAIFLAIGGFLFSVIGVTILAYFNTKDQNNLQNLTGQEDLQNMQAQNEPLDGYHAEPFDKVSATSLQVQTLKDGQGAAANASSTVKANYFGWTADGKIFDSSKKAGSSASAVEFPLNQVIAGWSEGLNGVKAGSVVKLLIPSDKAYGAAGMPPEIGPNEPLAFVVELIEVK